MPADYPYDDFKALYQQAWRAWLGLALTGPTPFCLCWMCAHEVALK